jgi:hypothetical protein
LNSLFAHILIESGGKGGNKLIFPGINFTESIFSQPKVFIILT